MEKVCTKCKKEKESSEFKSVNSKQCLKCNELGRVKSKKYYGKNKEAIKDKNDSYRKNNLDKVKTSRKKYYTNNKKEIFKRAENRLKERKSKDKFFNFIYNFKAALRGSFKEKGYHKSSRTVDILGCSITEFKKYLETKFESWMNWENRGLYNGQLNFGWDVDHVIPISSAKTEEEIIRLNHYTNLQPLCSKINRDIKKNKLSQ